MQVGVKAQLVIGV